jgi:zinc finger-like protein
VKNVAKTYSLEHEGESVLFDQLFELLKSNMQNGESYRRELASCTGALLTSISQHMFKEEEQVFICFFCMMITLLIFIIV